MDGWLVYCLHIHTREKNKQNESTRKKKKKKTKISPLLYKSVENKKEITHFESKLIAKRTQDLLLHHYVKPPHPQSREKKILFFYPWVHESRPFLSFDHVGAGCRGYRLSVRFSSVQMLTLSHVCA
jgi:hypothetical protein